MCAYMVPIIHATEFNELHSPAEKCSNRQWSRVLICVVCGNHRYVKIEKQN